MKASPVTLLEALERLAPGTPLRQAVQRIIQQGNGALIVMGSGSLVEGVCTGGFQLRESEFTPARLAELAKMDGAVVLDDSCERILRANVHLIPDHSLPTDETGARHRTAERVARQTGKPVVAVSEDRRLATLFFDGDKHELESPSVLVAMANQSLQTLERFRRRFDDAEERLTRLEVTDLTTYRAVVTVLRRAELVRRVGAAIVRDADSLGEEGAIVVLQLADLTHGVESRRDLTLRDYLRPSTARRVSQAAADLGRLSMGELDDPLRVASVLGFSHPDDQVRPRGLRILSQVPRLPEPVREALVRHFRDFQKMLHAEIEALDRVEGIGRTRAEQLRLFFDRLVDSVRAWGHEET